MPKDHCLMSRLCRRFGALAAAFALGACTIPFGGQNLPPAPHQPTPVSLFDGHHHPGVTKLAFSGQRNTPGGPATAMFKRPSGADGRPRRFAGPAGLLEPTMATLTRTASAALLPTRRRNGTTH